MINLCNGFTRLEELTKIQLIAVMEQVHDLSEALPLQASLTFHVEVLQDPCRRV